MKNLKRTAEKPCFALSDVKHIPAGTGKSGKEHGEFFLFTVLEPGATETTTFFTTAAFAEEIQTVLDTLDYLAPIIVTGDMDGAKFSATMVELDKN